MNSGKKVAILQSNYIPWKGYFDIINSVDEFILFDDAQYTKRDWRNRNKIKTPTGLFWLTIPVEVKGKYNQAIKDTIVKNDEWRKSHWKTISINYSKSKYFDLYKSIFEKLYIDSTNTKLSKINYEFIIEICKILGIKTKITWSMDYDLVEGKTKRLINLCAQTNATIYFSGPAGKDYINEESFRTAGIKLSFMDYSGYPEYRQLYPPFIHQVSIIDLLFNEGPNATNFMKSFQ